MGQTDLFKQIINRHTVFGVLAIAVLTLSTLASTMVSGLALSSYSITPTTASINADAGTVGYEVKFTPEESAGAFVIDFCANSPLIGQSCTVPNDMDVSGAATTDATLVALEMTDNKVVATKSMTADAPQTVTLTGLTNPTDAGAIYARIVTFANSAAAEAYDSTTPGTWVDTGSVSMYFNSNITVSGTVLETLKFCVAAVALTPDCGNADDSLASLVLGAEQGVGSGVFALTTGSIHERSLFTQINTNAASGAAVRLRSSAPCGGLLRAGETVCDIAPAPLAGFTGFDEAYFGIKLGALASTPATGATGAVGTLVPAAGSGYNATAFKINFAEGGATGVTSTLGDPFLDTNNAPATNQNMEIKFGATITNDTPGGTYSTDLSMIAVGKF